MSKFCDFALVLFVLFLSYNPIAHSQHPREWQSSAGPSIVAQLVSQTAGKVQLIDLNGKEYSLTPEKLSGLDRRYLRLQEIIQADSLQMEAVANHIDTMKTAPQSTIAIMAKLAKDYPNSPYASLWAGVAIAVVLNDTDRATIHFREASRRIRDQQKTDPSRHRRTLISVHINLAICFLKKQDAESACEEILNAFELANEVPSVLRHNGNQLAELSREGLGLKISTATRSKLVAALAKASVQSSKSELQTGWFYSLDLQPTDSLGTELSLIGLEPPSADHELITTGVGFVCAPDHILTVAKAVSHPYYQADMITAAVPKADGGWTLVPVKSCDMGNGKSDLALLRVDNLALKPVTFHESRDSVSGDLSILGFERGPEILKVGMKSVNGSIQLLNAQDPVFRTTASVDAGNRGGPCIDSSWRVVGISWQRSTEKGSRGDCYSLNGIRDWISSNAPTINLNLAPADSPKVQRENLRKSVVPILTWHKNQSPQDKQFGVLRDEWCIACRGKSLVPCRACRGVGQIQTGTTKVPAAYNRINGQYNYIDVPTKATCDNCDGKGKVRCTFCQNGKLPGGIGTGNR